MELDIQPTKTPSIPASVPRAGGTVMSPERGGAASNGPSRAAESEDGRL